jgi:acetylornithine deacetylase/succinyl-diaminopimelate desuccinylase-like protein
MSRDAALSASAGHFDSGAFEATLARLVAVPTESQNPERDGDLLAYLEQEIAPAFAAMGFSSQIVTVPSAKGPFLIAQRIEDPALQTVLGYGHGDVIRGLDAQWAEGLSPWALTRRGERWYGRGVVDNKGQHAINMAAQRQVIATRGRLGFNAKWIIEMGEEVGSPGLREVCAVHREALAADLFIASDGPRLSAERPTVFLGARGAFLVDFTVDLREGGHHSGNWGGLLANPGILLPMPSPPSSAPTGKSGCRGWCRRAAFPKRCARRWRIVRSRPAPMVRPSMHGGANRG